MKKFDEYSEIIDKKIKHLEENKLEKFINSQRDYLKKKLDTENLVQYVEKNKKLKEEKIQKVEKEVIAITVNNINVLERLQGEIKELIFSSKKITEDFNNRFNVILNEFDKVVVNLENYTNIFLLASEELLKLNTFLDNFIKNFDFVVTNLSEMINKNEYNGTFKMFEVLDKKYNEFINKTINLCNIDIMFYKVQTEKAFSFVNSLKNYISNYYDFLCKKVRDYYINNLKSQLQDLSERIKEQIRIKKDNLITLKKIDPILTELDGLIKEYNDKRAKLNKYLENAKLFSKLIDINEKLIESVYSGLEEILSDIKSFKSFVIENYINKMKKNLEKIVFEKLKAFDEFTNNINENNILEKFNKIKDNYAILSNDLEKYIEKVKEEIRKIRKFEKNNDIGIANIEIDYKIFRNQLFNKYREIYENIFRLLMNILFRNFLDEFLKIDLKDRYEYLSNFIKQVKNFIGTYQEEFKLKYSYDFYIKRKAEFENVINIYFDEFTQYYFKNLDIQRAKYQSDLNFKFKSKDSSDINHLLNLIDLYRNYVTKLEEKHKEINTEINKMKSELEKLLENFNINLFNINLNIKQSNIDLSLDISYVIKSFNNILLEKEKELNEKLFNFYELKIEEIKNLTILDPKAIKKIVDEYYTQYDRTKKELDQLLDLLRNVKISGIYQPIINYQPIEPHIKEFLEKEFNKKIDKLYNSKLKELANLSISDVKKFTEIIKNYNKQYDLIVHELKGILKELGYIELNSFHLKSYAFEKSVKSHLENAMNKELENIFNHYIKEINNLTTIDSKIINNILNAYDRKFKNIDRLKEEIKNNFGDFIDFNPEFKVYKITDNLKEQVKILLFEKCSFVENIENKMESAIKAMMYGKIENLEEVRENYEKNQKKIKEYKHYLNEIKNINCSEISKIGHLKMKKINEIECILKNSRGLENKNIFSRIFTFRKILKRCRTDYASDITKLDN
jgi:hypothetical protein